jgi:hypothetical protein
MTSAEPDEHLARAEQPDELSRRFSSRWVAAGGDAEDAERQFEDWLGGGYGICLRSPNPEFILAKGGLADAIAALIACPRPDRAWWRDALRHAVSAYDALVLPFASVDAARFGAPTSRTRLIDDVRTKWPAAFEGVDPAPVGAGLES